MNVENPWLRLQQVLDDRRDPLDDPELVAWLEDRPEHLTDVAQLRADACALAFVAPAAIHGAPRRRTHRRAALAAAAAVTALLGGWSLWPSAPTSSGGTRLLSLRFEELRPRARAAADYVVIDRLVHTNELRLETWQQRTEPR